MADLFPVAGARIFIGPATPVPSIDIVLADVSALSYTEIADWTTAGAFGDTSALITTQVISRKRDVKQKGTKNAGQMQNVFAINSNDVGQIALIAASENRGNYAFKIMWDDAPPAEVDVVTITIASPAVLTITGNDLQAGDPIKLSTTGALPTGLVAGTTYYVEPIDANTFHLAATPGGSAIATTGTQSGVHTLTGVPTGTVDYFLALVMNATEAGGGANTVRTLNSTLEINTNIITVDPTE